MTARTIIVGDLHGCYDEAIELLDACKATKDDRIIFTGDLVDRGPKPRECIELAMKHSSVLGNHEDKHLFYRDRGVKASKMPEHHAFTASQMSEWHYEFMYDMPLWIRVPEHNLVVIHAGLWPRIPLEEQDKRHLLHMQCVGDWAQKRSGWPSKSPTGTFWTNYYNGRERVVFGHTGLNKPMHTQFVTGLDTGCVFGRELTAYILPDNTFVQVKARGRHYGRDEHVELGKTDWKTLIQLDGDVCTFS